LLVASNPLIDEIAAASPSQKATTPTDITSPSLKHRCRLPAALDNPRILSGIIGRTHGVKFSRNPPTAAMMNSSQSRDVLISKSHPKNPIRRVSPRFSRSANNSVFTRSTGFERSTIFRTTARLVVVGCKQILSSHA